MFKTHNIQESLVYTNPEAAFEEYKNEECFYSMMEITLEEKHVEYTKEALNEFFQINVPDEYIVKMLSCDSDLTGAAFNFNLSDTDNKGRLMSYLGGDLLNLSWPSGTTSKEETSNLFKLWIKKIIQLGWADKNYNYGANTCLI